MSNYAGPHMPWHDNLPEVCACDPAWTERGLVDNDCLFHQMVEAIEELPDGSVFDGKFYPFMVDCFPCNSTGRANVSPARACSTCDDTGMVRNPALEWQQQWRPSFAYAWRTDTLSEHSTYASLETRWVAVGVKGNNK